MNDFLGGVVEGFYGRTWPWPVRRTMIEFFAREGLDTYVYAPKADSHLRRDWRIPHPPAEFAELLALRAHCRAQGVHFGIGFTPFGLQASYAAADRNALQQRMRELEALDCDVFCILFDDMQGAFDGLAARQCEIVADLLAVCSAPRVLVCPTYYSFDPLLEQVFGAMPVDYLEQLGAGLDARVDVLWTGAKVLAPGFSRADIDAVVQRLGRAPVLWDNYPVNDGARISRFLHLLPVRDRPWQLSQWCRGHLANPMNQAFLSQVPLASLARNYRLRDDYDADAFWRTDLPAIVGAPLATLLQRDIELLQLRGLDAIAADERAELADEYRRIDHPAAAELVDWLGEGYRFDPECLTG